MKVAILGAGFAGLGTALFLLIHSNGRVSIDLFDPKPIGYGISGLSAGLLHPFPGKRAQRVWNADALLNGSHRLITEASRGINKSLILSQGILRPAITPSQIEAFQKTAQNHPQETQWWDHDEALEKIPGLQIVHPHGGALYIKNGITLNAKEYLIGLWQMSLRFGLQFHQREISEEKDLKPYDKVIWACGMGVKKFSPLKDLPLYPLKGQSLRILWPQNLAPLPFSLISDGYIVMDSDQKTCVIGATFERQFENEKPNIPIASSHIREKIGAFFPELAHADILECQAGIRAIYAKTSLPISGKIDSKYWFITGLGTKGLLFHGFMADFLAQAVLEDNESLIPLPLRY